MYNQRNQSSGTLLTQAFHPHSAEDQFSQGFLEEQQQQQQQQYNQEQLEEIQEQLNSSNIIQRFQMADNNGFPFQAFENNAAMLGSSLPSDWTQNYGDEMSEFVFSNGGVFVDGLISQNYVNDPSWVLAQAEQQSLHHVGQQQDSQQQINASENTVSQNNDHAHLRAQTPGPLQKTNIPNYLTMRRRSLSADNIHALAKAQAARKAMFAAQQSQSSLSPSMNFEQQVQFSSIQNSKQQTLNPNGFQLDDANNNQINNENDGDINNHNSQNTSGNTSPNSQNTRSHLSRTSSASPINHAQRLNELQARFKVKLDKRTQRSMPNIQLTAAAQSAMPLSQVKSNTSTGTPIMDLSSVSTPNTPTFPPEKSKLAPPRRGHMRKRSLSAPTAPFQSQNAAQMPGSIPMQPAQSFPLNFSLSSSFRRNALPIQIQRNPKHNHNSPPLSSEEYQRKLDEELEKVDFEDITVSELKEMLRQRGKPATGKKAILMQRLQEEIMSTPTSPSGVSLQSRIANLHISSPPIHSRRFSPYGSVSIPGSPRMMPSGLGNGRPQSGFNGGNLSFPESAEEWQFQNVGLVQGNMSQPLLPHNLDDASIMIMGQQSHDIYGSQQPSSAPPTITEFDAVTTSEFQGFQQPSSAPPMTTEFVDTYDFMNPMSMNVAMSINPDMMRLSVSDVDDPILLKQEPGNENKNTLANLNVESRPQSGSIVSAPPNDTGMLVQQGLGFGFNPQHHLQDENMMIKSEDNLDFLNYTTTNMASAQQLPMQIELPQDGMTYGGW
ncbi:11715_t:CDS:2 [Funneliformis caledonium]|uniref:11715_t:CDS:1 n=1 Tax=Funneliformis caledonium TaxID=1117310 RepID=A0A9N8YUC3_9GLOM|nr:11715_t:CDS:2 [Funneliformis caledonium]